MKNQKGSITLYVLMSVLFFVFVLVGIYVSFTNRATMEKEQLKQIQSDYNKYDTDEKLNDLYNKLSREEAAVEEDAVYNENGDKIISYAIDKNGDKVPIPTGFYYVGGTINSGVVISDNQLDENLYKNATDVGKDLLGNQFVWVPVDGTNIKYEKDYTYSDRASYEYNAYKTESVTRDSNGTITYYQGAWKDDGGDKASVSKYGGFYIGRYEAGYPTEVHDGDNYIGRTQKDVTTAIPVSKAGVMPWNYICQKKSAIVSENMYNSPNSSVTSKLVDSYAWDTTVNWLIRNCSKVTSANVLNSSNYGNYTNKTTTINNVLYAYRIKRTNKSTNSHDYINVNLKYRYANNSLNVSYESNITDTTQLDEYLGANNYDTSTYKYDKLVELSTGASEDFKTNNIYDLAGNMWEYTTESRVRKHTQINEEIVYIVMRSGEFGNVGSAYPITYRNGGWEEDNSIRHAMGFRVVLYIK